MKTTLERLCDILSGAGTQHDLEAISQELDNPLSSTSQFFTGAKMIAKLPFAFDWDAIAAAAAEEFDQEQFRFQTASRSLKTLPQPRCNTTTHKNQNPAQKPKLEQLVAALAGVQGQSEKTKEKEASQALLTPDPISEAIAKFKAGQCEQAFTTIWEHFYEKLLNTAKARLKHLPDRIVDEEDLASEVWFDFYRGLVSNNFPICNDGEDLWQILLMLLRNEIHISSDKHMASKRDFRREEPIQLSQFRSDANSPVNEPISHELDPQVAAALEEEIERLLQALPDDNHREVVLLKLEGHTNAGIAELLNRSIVTVELRLSQTQKIWKELSEKELSEKELSESVYDYNVPKNRLRTVIARLIGTTQS